MRTNQRRAQRAVDEAEEPCDEAQSLIRLLDAATSDGAIDLTEYRAIRRQAVTVLHEAKESLIAAQWVEVGERKCGAGLLDIAGETERARDDERQVLALAHDLGMTLGNVRPMRQRSETPTTAA